MKLRHPAGALIVFAVLATLCFGIYQGFQDNYDVQIDTADAEGRSLMQNLKELNLTRGVNTLSEGIQGLANAKPTNPADLLGALASAGTGVLQIVGGIVTAPIKIFNVITKFYHIPAVVIVGFGAIIILYIGFVILSAYLRQDV